MLRATPSAGLPEKLASQKLRAGDWSNLDAYAALRCAPAVAIPVIIGTFTGHAATGVMIAAGAFSVGFGSSQQLHRSRLLPMLLAAFGMCLSSWAGTLAGFSSIASVLLAAVMALIYATAFRSGRAASWVALQCAIWFVISTAYPNHGIEALNRGSMVLVGGLSQIIVVFLLLRMERKLAWGAARKQPSSTNSAFTLLPGEWIHFAFRATLTIAVAAGMYRWLSVQNGYWIPITSLIVLRPGLEETVHRGVARGLGTAIGVAVAGLIVAATFHSPWMMTAGVCIFAAGSYTVFSVNYAYFAACLTAYVVFLLSLAGIREEPLITHRIVFTLMGVVLALGLHWTAAWIERGKRP